MTPRAVAGIGAAVALVAVIFVWWRKHELPPPAERAAPRAVAVPVREAPARPPEVRAPATSAPGRPVTRPERASLDPEKARKVFQLLTRPPPEPSAAADPEADYRQRIERSRAAFDRGQDLFVDGREAEAAEAFLEAYGEYPSPPFLYNAAVSLRKSGLCPDAIELFQRYLQESAAAQASEPVRKMIEGLTRGCEEGK